MSRSRFGLWGSALNDVDFSYALAALGVVGCQLKSLPPSEREGKLDSIMKQAVESNAILQWKLCSLPERVGDSILPVTASKLKEAWQPYVGKKFRIEIQESKYVDPLMPWLVSQLSRNELPVRGLYVRHEISRDSASWNWPLNIGLLKTSESDQLLQHLKDTTWRTNLVSISELEAANAICDLLVLPWSPSKALIQVLKLPYRIRASCIALLGQIDIAWDRASTLLYALQVQTRASGICLIPIPKNKIPEWFNFMIYRLSHNNPLDNTFLESAREYNAQKNYLFLASRRLIEKARLENFVGVLTKSIKRLPSYAGLNIPAEISPILGLIPGPRLPKELSSELQKSSKTFRYNHETREASGIGLLARTVNKVMESASLPAKPRYVQSQLFEVPSAGPMIRRLNALHAGTPHALIVRVGPSDHDWLTPAEEAIFPEGEIVWRDDMTRLRAVFSEPNHAPEPQIGSITLPRTGASTTCQFTFTPRGDIPYFQGRVIVLHRNRVLQTALLEGTVVADADQCPDKQLRFAIESVIRPNLSDLQTRQDFDVAFVTNHTAENAAGVTTIADEHVSFRKPKETEMDKAISEIRSVLQEVTTSEDVSRSIEEMKDITWLRSLALYGSALYDAIVRDLIGPDRLTNIRRIQLVSAYDDYLPLEFFYEMPPPKLDAPLCPNSTTALKKGAYCIDCQHLVLRPAECICPLGFWGLRLIIERHYVSPQSREELKAEDYSLQAEPIGGRQELTVLKSAICAASDKVDAVAPGQSQAVLHTLEKATQNNAEIVDTLQSWKDAVKTRQPSLLVLLPHTSTGDPTLRCPQMEIGKGVVLPERFITQEYIRPSPTTPAPVVLLLGCKTLSTSVPFQSFVAQFRRNGAAIVLSTLTQVLGRHAAPIAAKLVQNLKQAAEQGTSFGDALLSLRQNGLAEGFPTVLGLVAYGDADWRLKAAEAN